VVNVITGVIIFVALVYTYGEKFYTMEEVNKHGIVAYEIGLEIGLQSGDRIVGVNDQPVSRFNELTGGATLLGTDVYYNVDRAGTALKVNIPDDLIEKLSDKKNVGLFIEPRVPFEVGKISKGSEAEKMGLQEGDKLVALNGQPIPYFNEFEVEKLKYKNDSIALEVERDGRAELLTGVMPDDGVIGFLPVPLLASSFEHYGFRQAISKGTDRAFTAVWINMKGLGKMISGKIDPTKSMMGPIGIARVFGGTWNWERFWNLTGLLSMILAFMNFLPIPALDGGHVMFLSYEIISGRAPGDKFLEIAQKAGMIFLLALMAFVIGNDIFKLF